MKTSRYLAASLPVLAVFASAAFAAGSTMNTDSPAVEKLKSKLPSTLGFEVKDVRTSTDGTSCITYVVANANGGTSTQHAVVEGDKVERDTNGNSRFVHAWKDKCSKGS